MDAEWQPDPDASYEAVHRVDLSDLSPRWRSPHDVGNVIPVGDVDGLRIDQAFIGSCTNGRIEDLRAAAAILEGRHVAPGGARLLVAPASRWVMLAAIADGTLGILVKAGASVLAPGCGPCFEGTEGLLAPGERCIGTHTATSSAAWAASRPRSIWRPRRPWQPRRSPEPSPIPGPWRWPVADQPIRGKVRKFGDAISTDLLSPAPMRWTRSR